MALKRRPGDQPTPGSVSHSAPRAALAPHWEMAPENLTLQAQAAGVKVLMGAKL